MKTDVQTLQDLIADLQRAAAGHAGTRRDRPPALQIRVTLSTEGQRTDADPAAAAESNPAWTISLPGYGAAAPH